mgnify:CR=1 FL=1
MAQLSFFTLVPDGSGANRRRQQVNLAKQALPNYIISMTGLLPLLSKALSLLLLFSLTGAACAQGEAGPGVPTGTATSVRLEFFFEPGCASCRRIEERRRRGQSENLGITYLI